MANDFQRCEIGALIRDGALLINDGYRAKNSELSSSGLPFARAGNIDSGFHFDNADRVPSKTLARVGLKRSRPGDVVFTSKGTVGRFAYVRASTPEFVYSPQLCYWRSCDLSRIHPRWLFYWMNSQEFYLQYKGVAGQTDMAEYVSLGDQRAMKITLPPIQAQQAIASILGALDDKIELNRRMNATLEEMARALFKSWFVDFDPVRAKLDGRQPTGMDAATAALFPSHFQETSLGHIPSNWCISELSHLTAILNRGIGPSYIDEGGVCVLNQKCVRDHRIDFTPSRRHDTAKRSVSERTLCLYDMLVNSTGTGTLGRVAQVLHLPEPTIVDSHVTILRANKSTNPHFLAFAVLDKEPEIEALGEGSTGQTELSRTRLGQLPIITPSAELQNAFGQIVHPILQRVALNEAQSRTLAALRDTLLPKLLSGEIRVPA